MDGILSLQLTIEIRWKVSDRLLGVKRRRTPRIFTMTVAVLALGVVNSSIARLPQRTLGTQAAGRNG
jgi:hypothetical protein